VAQPMLRIDGALKVVDWEVALTAAAEGLQRAVMAHGGAAAGFLSSPLATVEELYLLAQIARGLKCANIDHRLRQLDFRAQEHEAGYPNLGLAIADVERLDGALMVGSNLRHEMPMLAHRIRKAALKGGLVGFLNPRRFEYMFPVAGYVVAETDMVGELTALVHAAAGLAGKPAPAGAASAAVTDSHRSLIGALCHGPRRAVILGTLAQRHPAYSQLKSLSTALAELCGASVGVITEGANSAGAYLAGAVSHREPGGAPAAPVGLSSRAMLESALRAYVLFGGIDPANDLAAAATALETAELVISISTHLPESLRAVASVVLPIGSFAETSGTYVNSEGRWQSWSGAAKLPGESRPGWKVLRVLANLLNLHGVDYDSSEEIRDALKTLCGKRVEPERGAILRGPVPNGQIPKGVWVDIPPYQSDVLVRGSDALAKTKDGRLTRSVL
jgi:NADH-quinone oxidoreductase subunit G